MKRSIPAVGQVFKANPSTREAKGDATTVAARAIIDREANALDAKTERLRALRLARDAAEAAHAPPAGPRRRARKA